MVVVVTYETGLEDHGGWCELAEDQKQTELVTEYWSRIRPQHFLVWFQPPQHSTAELATKAIRRYAKILQSWRRPPRALSWLKAPNTAFTFMTLLTIKTLC